MAVHQEGHGLHLLDVIEAAHADVSIGEGRLAGPDLVDDRVGIGAAEHRQLPHGPVPVVVVASDEGRVNAGAAVVGSVCARLIGEPRQGVAPVRTMYSICFLMSSSERGGRKEKVSKNLLSIGCHTIMAEVLYPLDTK